MTLNKHRLYSDVLELEKNLRELLKNEPSHAATVMLYRSQLIEKTKALVQLDAAFAASKEVEQLLWKPCFYKRIEEFRNRIRKYAAAPSTDRTVRDRFSLVSVEFQQFLTESSQFYQALCDQYMKWLHMPQVSRIATSKSAQQSQTEEDEAGDDDYHEKKEQEKAMDINRMKCRQSIHRSLIFLGDLARYRELHSQKAKKNFVLAESYYHQALQVIPGNGNPHNQLAVLATYVDSETVAVYHYCRSLLIAHPFVTAEENLVLLFERSRQRPLAPPPLTPLTKGLTAREKAPFLKSFLHRLTRLYGVLYSNAVSQETDDKSVPLAYSREMECILKKDIKPLLEMHLIGDTLLLKLAVISIFCLEKAVKTSMTQNALRLSLLLPTCVLRYILQDMHKTRKKENGSALRLLGPISVFCDYLKCHPFVLEEMEDVVSLNANENEPSNSDYVTSFLEALTALINHPKLKSYDGNMQAKLFSLKENIELRGFLPLAKVYDPSSQLWSEQDFISKQGSFSNTASISAMSEAENLKVRAWNLSRFAVYLCEEFEGNPLLYSNNGTFSVSPVTVASNTSSCNASMEATVAPKLPSLVLGILDDVADKKKTLSTTSSSSIMAESQVKAAEQEDDNMDDEVILFQPAFLTESKFLSSNVFRENSNANQQTAEPFKPFRMDQYDNLHSPFSVVDQNGNMGNLGALKCPTDFHSFSAFGSFSSSTASANPSPDFDSWNSYESGSYPTVNQKSLVGQRIFAPNANALSNTMADLAAIEHRSNLFQKEQSSLSSLFSSSRESKGSQGQTHERATPPRPPPGFIQSQRKISSAVLSDSRAFDIRSPMREDKAHHEDTSTAS